MNFKEQYKNTFLQVHTAVRIETEEVQTLKPIHKAKKSLVAVAAVICLLLAGTASAYAANLFGLKDLVLKQSPMPAPSSAAASSTPENLISLQGYPDSSEYKAAAEWADFRANYDKDGALLAKVGNNPTPFDKKYGNYGIYTQEMADKLDEITAKYGLKLHSALSEASDNSALCALLGTGDFLGTQNKNLGAYAYDDKSFHIDGEAVLADSTKIDYQFMDCRKGSFSDVYLNIGDISTYKEWTYKTKCGVTVNLALSSGKALIVTDLGNAFVTVNVLAGTDSGFVEMTGPITRANLEALADSFDYTMLK